MERLLEDAGKLANTKFDISSYADVIEAIHVIQDNMGITGTTAKEANFTIQGSISSMKAAWGNLMPALIKGGDEFDQCVDNLIESIVGVKDESGKMSGGVLNNVMPALEKALGGIGTLIERLAPIIEDELPVLIDRVLPPLVKAATALLKGLITSLPNIIKVLIAEFPNIAKQLGEGIAEAFNLKAFVKPITKVVGVAGGALLAAFVAFKGFTAFKSISSLFSSVGDTAGGVNKGAGPLSSLAKTSPKTILKGLANLAIIIGGLTLIAGALMLIAPFMAQLSDFKSILKVVAVIGVLGILGTALAFLAGKIGNIPVATVALGLANMAIVLVGFGALAAVFMWLAPYIAALGDLKSVLKVAAIMAVLGVVGTALTVFAGVAGLIPIPVVLLGLANIALVLGGIAAIVVAFGALSKIKGFNEFIDTGGQVLVKLCNILGEMAGALIGGIGEGVTSSLPKIGENLSEFAKSLKPMFETFNGVDMTGIGNFFAGFGQFMLLMAGEKILSVFTGKTNYAELGTQLTTFATNAEGFFTKVAALPEKGFSNAKLFFECLAGVKGLPKEGGIKSWFTGDIAYDSLATGLGKLSGEKVTKFFETVATIKDAGFTNAKTLFDTLAGIKGLPTEGGIKSWFTGKINYDDIASGLGKLSGEGVTSFLSLMGGQKANAFTNAKSFFDALASVKAMPTTGVVKKKSVIKAMGEDLKSFGTDTKEFFAQVNKLDISNLNALWASLEKAGTLTSENLTKMLDDSIKDLVSKVTELPKQMADGIKSSGSSLADALVAIWETAVKATVAPVNKVISGANWLLKEFGSNSRVEKWQPYARGTSGHKGGNAIVNDGNGAELVQMPNGNTFIPRGRNVLLPNAPKGMKVLDAGRTAKLMGKGAPTFRYANGTGDIDVWNYIDDSKALINKVFEKFVSYDGMSGYALNMGKAMVSTIKGAMPKWVDKVIEETGAKSIGDYVASAGVSQWKTTVARALKMEGLYSATNVARTLFQMQTESGGNPRAINLWDSNAKNGIPSKGLMQVIDPTFKAYARAGYNSNIYDPLSNILASVRYAKARYGSLTKAYQGHGYSGGVGSISIPQYTPSSGSFSSTSKTEAEYNTYSPVFNLTINGAQDERAIARRVKQWVAEAMEECFEGMARRNAHA